MINIISFLSGIIFSIGLVISGMTNPEKVIGFLDIFGKWDLSLAFVMGGAVTLNIVVFYLAKKMKHPVFDKCFQCPTKIRIEKRLLIGAALFGVGWGILGICPGPGIVNLAKGNTCIIIFIISMTIGMFLSSKLLKKIESV